MQVLNAYAPGPAGIEMGCLAPMSAVWKLDTITIEASLRAEDIPIFKEAEIFYKIGFLAF
jgi:hypothetical protein